MPSPRLHNHFEPSNPRPDRGQKSFGARPFLLVSVHAALQATDALAIPVDGET